MPAGGSTADSDLPFLLPDRSQISLPATAR